MPSSGVAINKADELIGDFFGEASDKPAGPLNCNTNPFECGPPTVTLFGGGGIGAAGAAIVNSIGEVVGVDLFFPGKNYKSAPFVSITDSCGNGNYASAYSEINRAGEVTRIVITNTGSGYLSSPNGLDEFGNVIGTDSPPVTDTDVVQANPSSDQIREYIGCIVGFDVKNTGIDYTENDSISLVPDVPGLNTTVTLTEQGQIISLNVTTPACDIIEIPKVVINSNTGVGAVITPIVEYTRVSSLEKYTSNKKEEYSQLQEIVTTRPLDDLDNVQYKNKLIRVIDCVK